MLSIQAAARKMIKENVLADIRCGGATVMRNVFIPEDTGFCAIVLPYNGGKLPALSLVEHVRTQGAKNIVAIAVRHTPPLTKAEKAAIGTLPAYEGNLIPIVPLCWAWSVIAIAALVTLVAGCASSSLQAEEALHLSDEDVKRLGPEATARELLQLRRKALGV